jgi:hypothetical protein
MAVDMPKAMKFVVTFVFAGKSRDESGVYWGLARSRPFRGMVVEKG